MSNLFTFGCSHTFGMCLPDRGISDKTKDNSEFFPTDYTDVDAVHGSKYVWGQVLAQKLNMKCVNRGVVGASIKETTWHFDQTCAIIKQGDIVCFLWPYLVRYTLLKEYMDNNMQWQGRRWLSDSDMTRGKWNEIFDVYDAKFVNKLYIEHTSMKLEKMGVKSYHMFCEETELAPDVNLSTDNFNDIRDSNDLSGVPNDLHGGIKTHEAVAQSFYNMIETQ